MVETDERHILHVDMDAFYAAVEQRDNPELRGKPVLVGGSPDGRGVVSTASYEARPFGCRSAMPTGQALRLCPDAIVLRPRMSRYVEVSRQVFAIFESFTPLVEPLSIDEAFLDVSGSMRLFGSAERIARDIAQRIREETRLTASIGVAPCKFAAKLASDLRKPDGLVVVPRDGLQRFLDELPIERMWGAGPATLRRFEKLHIRTFADVRRLSEREMHHHFGELGDRFYRLVRGDDTRDVVPDHEAKSISHEQTFATDLREFDAIRMVLLHQVEDVARRLRRQQLLARTVTLKLRRPDFHTITRRATLETPTDETDLFWRAAVGLLDAWKHGGGWPVRLIGFGVSHLTEGETRQLSLFDAQSAERRRSLDQTMDRIRDRYGKDAIRRGGVSRRERPPGGDEPQRHRDTE